MATLLTPATTPAEGAPDPDVCVSCGVRLAGEWCHACGERRHTPEQLSLRHALREFGDDVFGVDSRLVRSLRLLLFRPGFLTLEHIRGRRRPYLGPLRMYLTTFAVTLFVTLLVPRTAATSQANPLEAVVNRVVHAIAERRGMTEAAAKKALEETSAQHVTWLSVLIPLLFAAFLFAFFRRRRRWFGEHLVFATHFGTFNFLVALILIPFQLALGRFGPGTAAAANVLVIFPMFAWMMIAVRRVYDTGKGGAVGWSLLLFIAFSIAQAVTGVLALCTAALSILWLGA